MIGRVYKLISPHTDRIYIGSTTKPLHIRLNHHIQVLKRNKSGSSKIITSFGECKIELLEEGEFENKNALLTRERYYIDNNINIVVNKCLPTQSYTDSLVRTWNKNREKYYARRAEKVACDICGKNVSRGNLNRHKKLH